MAFDDGTCTCANGLAGNCGHIAAALLRIAELRGDITLRVLRYTNALLSLDMHARHAEQRLRRYVVLFEALAADDVRRRLRESVG